MRLLEPCVIVQIAEGLGNQMFCYAAARALSIQHNVPLYLDIASQYRVNKFNRKFLLDHYNIAGRYLNNWLSYIGNIGQVLWKAKILRSGRNAIFYVEKDNIQNQNFNMLRMDYPLYLLGYWQHEDYFFAYREQLLQDFTRKSLPSMESLETARKIENVNAVCLHIRSYKELKHSTFTEEYYQKAIKYMIAYLENPYFFVFSDDFDRVKKKISISAPFDFVTCNIGNHDKGSVDDLWLISKCKHHILSSSSFSWWGVWLADKPKGTVLVPKDSALFTRSGFLKNWTSI
jgi:hypothetical protein